MSFFYLSPVKGDMPIHLIETIVDNRLHFLSTLHKKETPGFNEYIIEGSVYDNVGHFMLCLVSTIDKNSSLKQFVYKSEIELFKQRIESLTEYDLRTFAKKIIRTIKKYNVVYSYIDSLQVLCQHLMLKSHAQHVFNNEHYTECRKYCIQVGFKTCLHFVANRQVQLEKGVAIIPCGIWKEYLILLFKEHLHNKLNNKNNNVHQDPRLSEILFEVGKRFPMALKNNNKNALKSISIDNYVSNFPPCMRNLHINLRIKHRLPHQDRFHYSLFLKDIGMPLEEAIEFWKLEYNKSPNGTNTCCHNWGKDEKKFIYEIRHLYGLEGSRKSYTSVSCSRLQGTMNVSSESGCPFKTMDPTCMSKLLNLPNITEDCLSQIKHNIYHKKYTLACKMYHDFLYPEVLKKYAQDHVNFTPVLYYLYSLSKN